MGTDGTCECTNLNKDLKDAPKVPVCDNCGAAGKPVGEHDWKARHDAMDIHPHNWSDEEKARMRDFNQVGNKLIEHVGHLDHLCDGCATQAFNSAVSTAGRGGTLCRKAAESNKCDRCIEECKNGPWPMIGVNDGARLCRKCHRQDAESYTCDTCGTISDDVAPEDEYAGSRLVCSECMPAQCANCGSRLSDDVIENNGDICEDCSERQNPSSSAELPDPDISEYARPEYTEDHLRADTTPEAEHARRIWAINEGYAHSIGEHPFWTAQETWNKHAHEVPEEIHAATKDKISRAMDHRVGGVEPRKKTSYVPHKPVQAERSRFRTSES